ncbi:GntR family transcriptional regulator [Deinococcus peraridilitoris]|uniref:Transcriptional regulator n=1 Tax=Deinococcus peraridilitoris (strain DSM 19664 / LMG 22246 / CIP 109416 / KR-200) TaxID=937777 RepID=K9ZZS0_DEIPD|nr:GntR family transcriptional regulator [Deinococcus peraridilitoris]AFZ66442.1 transcriptional regulator [Deinococcus peraridilitoris DSM 19664]
MGTLQPIEQERVVDTVRTTLRKAILEGDLPAGAHLSVPDLARRLNVSRSPVREAVLQLVAEGLAVEHSRRGAEVARVAGDDLREIQAVRTVLEGLAARLCAAQFTDSDMVELTVILERQADAVRHDDGDQYRELDTAFHTLIVERSGNRRLARMAKLLAAEMRVASRVMAEVPGHAQRGYHEHREICEAIGQRDVDGAERAMRRHLDRVASDTLQRLLQQDKRPNTKISAARANDPPAHSSAPDAPRPSTP